ncbi:MAG TPA: type II toxin-antitoxin system Phd/YefM family antitoxin [Candidatus Binatia bacterium]|jgi:antitoxin (DNA-binding transcriptional repressor) of toxin-antitoxin stability system|nr:type II toxin-antitoxin system Phd/YefM family antitoxin [Candidatus Binatia bacterium]
MSNVINVHDFKTNYSKYLDRTINGEELLLGKHGKAVAKLIPLPQAKMPRQPGALKGKIWISNDFDKPMMALWDTVADKK